MADTRAAARYAKSLLELAKEQNLVEQVHQDVRFLTRTFDENRNLRLILQSPLRHEKKLAILKEIFQTRVSSLTFSMLELISNKKREDLIYDVAAEYHRMYNEYNNIQVAYVTTTFPLDDAMRTQFKQIVTSKTGKTVELHEKIDPQLVGGFVLRVGDWQIDESLKSRLQSLKYRFSQN